MLCETDAASARPSVVEDLEEQQGAADEAHDTASGDDNLPLYNLRALKLWVQLCCQVCLKLCLP